MTSGAVYVLVVNFGPSGQQWQFGFATMATAKQYFDALVGDTDLLITDDYGQSGWVKAATIHGALLRDPSAVAEVEIAMMVQANQNQNEAMRRLQSGPSIVPAPGHLRFPN